MRKKSEWPRMISSKIKKEKEREWRKAEECTKLKTYVRVIIGKDGWTDGLIASRHLSKRNLQYKENTPLRSSRQWFGARLFANIACVISVVLSMYSPLYFFNTTNHKTATRPTTFFTFAADGCLRCLAGCYTQKHFVCIKCGKIFTFPRSNKIIWNFF